MLTLQSLHLGPNFRLIGSFAELYAPSKTGLPPRTHTQLHGERNLQRRWLLKSHPEAYMGNDVLSELLTEDLARFPKSDEPTIKQPLLALGEMTDWTITSKPVATRLLAAATGASGELLRLTHVEDSQWIWNEDKESALHLSVIDSLDNFEEVTWASDGLPISQIKFVNTTSSTSDAVRWLLVQKQTSTSILQPGYDRIPRSRDEKGQAGTQQGLSRISPNLLVTLGHHETGGAAHVDAAISQPANGQPPQLCVIDECGYWTLWNVLGRAGLGKSSIRLSLCKCGHVLEGPIREVPRILIHTSQHHGVFFVGTAQSRGKLSNKSKLKQRSQEHSRYLLTWNSGHINVLDLETDISLPTLDLVTSMPKHDRIIDLQPSPVSRDHVLVLTTKSLVWVNVFHSSRTLEADHQPVALLACPHLSTDSDSLKLSVSRFSYDDNSTFMVIVYSTRRAQASVFWFRLTAHALPEWHRQRITLPHGEKFDQGVQLLTFQPSTLASSPRARGPGVRYQQEGGQFFQGMVLGDDLGLSYCMAFTSHNPSLTPSLPTTRLGWTQLDQHKRWRKKRLRILHRMGEYFVVPDAMAQMDKQLMRRPPRGDDGNDTTFEALGTNHRTATPNPATLNVGHFARTIMENVYVDNSQNVVGIPVPLIDAVQGLIQHGHLTGTLPLRTWLDVLGDISNDMTPNGSQALEGSSQEALDALFGTANGQTVLAQLGPDLPTDLIASLHETRARFDDVWLQPLRDGMPESYMASREQWISELATAITLETYGVAVQDSPLFSSLVPASAQLSQAMPSSIPFPPSSQIPSSQVYGSSLPPSSQTQPSGPGPNEAFERLQLLAPGIQPGNIGASKPAQLLSLWPTERGVSIEDYVSSVAIATERKFDPAKQRLQKIEAKRRAMTDKYRLPPSMRRGLSSQAEPHQTQQEALNIPMRPAQPSMAGFMTSQQVPSSSQSQAPVTMSQPMSGAFGERKKTKKTKKKSGFR